MKASVVVPVHNKAAHLRACIDSVLGQSFTGFELIAVDDASTDSSLEILRSYGDARMRVIALPRNVGPGMAAQAGHDAATGEYIIRVDADDVQHPERFAKQVAYMDAHPDVGICGGHLKIMGTGEIRQRPATDPELKALLLFDTPVYQPTMILRRQLLLDHGIRYMPEWPRYGEDRLLEVMLLEHTRFADLQEWLVEYREGGISSRRSAGDLHHLYRMVFQQLGLPEPSVDELAVHAYAAKHFSVRPTAQTIQAFKQWLGWLKHWNDGVKRFEAAALETILGQQWDDLFHYLPPYGIAPVWAYLKCGGRLDAGRMYYLLRTLKW